VDTEDKTGKTAMDYICKDVIDPVEKKEKSEQIRKLLQEAENNKKK